MSDWLGLGVGVSVVGRHMAERRAMEVRRIMAKMQDEQAFMEQYRDRDDVRFERRSGGLVAVIDGGPSVPTVKRGGE